ncbi:carboxymuconolactone decarboxylase family protein [Antrihabitans sp. YC3-6]|uniref:Carboxymuconolactone decarboxylase family protein n=1 Tax=Antrihabitans stalagmiti TaxID=2799499 RepID=A0A934NLE0_9NOCA|nr:carboxymuconolactone decarboxylase family protein [Antrihabitans stalagmiti]MBJ8337282.1 carboxymuconolactone decarboxylase family protein [Antrihabitans stalagmiti]
MTEPATTAHELIGDVAPKLAALTDDVLFGDVWTRDALSPRDRSLITCAALIANGNVEQLRHHLTLAVTNGVTPAEITEAITHLAFYAGWPRAMSAIAVAREIVSTR